MDQVLQIIQSIPEGQNPYTYLATFMRNHLLPDTGRTLSINLTICSVLLVIALFFAIVLLWGKIRLGETWICKRKDTALGLLWLPNSGFLWAAISIVYLIVVQADLWIGYMALEKRISAVPMSYFFPYKWIFLFAAIWVETHGYAASAFLASYQRKTTVSGYKAALAFNIFFAFGYIFGFVAPLVNGFTGPHEFALGWHAGQDLLRGFDAAASSWDSVSDLVIQPIWLTQFETFAKHFAEYARLTEVAYTVLLANFLYITVFYFIAAFFYTKCLRSQINRDFDQLSRAYSKDQQNSKLDHVSELRLTYRLLLAKAICLACMAVTYVGLVIAPVSDFATFFTDPGRYTISAMGQYYPFCVFGTLILASMAFRVWQDRLRTATSRRSTAADSVRLALGLPFSVIDQIAVASETVVTIDHADGNVIGMSPRYKMKDQFAKQSDLHMDAKSIESQDF